MKDISVSIEYRSTLENALRRHQGHEISEAHSAERRGDMERALACFAEANDCEHLLKDLRSP